MQLGNISFQNYQNSLTLDACAFWHIDKLRKGLTRFAGPAEVALVLSGKHFPDPLVFDDQKLLAHLNLAILKEQLGDCLKPWNEKCLADVQVVHIRHSSKDEPEETQDWFIHTRTLVSPKELIEKWLKQAARYLHGALKAKEIMDAVPGCVAIEHFLPHIIGGHLDEMSRYESDPFRYAKVTEALQISAEISRTVEEGTRPSGCIGFFDFPRKPAVEMFAEFEEPISLAEYKRLGKLLQAVRSGGCLVSDYRSVLGISRKKIIDDSAVTVEFDRGLGTVSCRGVVLCRIVGGQYRCANSEDASTVVGKFLEKQVTPECISVAGEIIRTAISNRHGCTVVVDLSDTPLTISGERLKKPVNLSEAQHIVANVGRIDGAVHIGKTGEILSFGCLLDGVRSDREDRSRGARFNSALRFTQSQKDVFVLVVSSDGPVTIFKEGQVIYSDPFSAIDHYRVPETGIIGIPASTWLNRLEQVTSKVPQ